MYLGYLEKIVAATVAQLGGPQDWALPYWNYSSATGRRTLSGGVFLTGSHGQLHPPALHSQVANLRIADSQNLANANYSNPLAALTDCGQGRDSGETE